MIQKQFMASWVTIFKNHVHTQLEKQAEPFITFQISTIGQDGFPKSRTVVYRGFLFDDESTNVITMTSDKRMGKYADIMANDKFEAVFYLNGAKRQFRFRGQARIIDDEHQPVISLNNFKPRDVGTSDSDSEAEVEAEAEREDDVDDIMEFSSTSKRSRDILSKASTEDSLGDGDTLKIQEGITLLDLNDDQIKGKSVQGQPLNSNLLSPKLLKNLYKNHNASFTSLSTLADINYSDLQDIVLEPPTHEEYAEELTRQWNNMSKTLKKSFRRPEPGSNMTSEKAKLIDSIKRGVDGKKDVDGFKNFAVLCLFPEFVDFYDVENDKRYFFEKDKYDLWTEHEVCP